jgi:5-methylthioadenosine/S-adenosylhomocysteine deaminase
LTPALFCHSTYMCSPDTLREAWKICLDRGLSLFCHVSETEWEIREIRERYGVSPVEHLHGLGLLSKGFAAVHAVHVSESDIDLFARSGASAVHCPESNMKLASGAAPVKDLIKHGVVTALGTDGPASNNNLDLFEEMRTASLAAKLVTGDPAALDAATCIRMATIDGAKALGLDHIIGSLEPGKQADVIVVDLNRPHLSPLYNPASHLVYCARGSDVRDVWVNGARIVRNGSIVTVDRNALLEKVGETAVRIAAEFEIGPRVSTDIT